MRRPLTLALLAAAALPASAMAASLPSVQSGARPGPPLLYADPPVVPELSVKAPFAAAPLLVSGTDAYRSGEYVYQDYLFDDRGANTVGGRGSRGDPSSDIAASTAGDVKYPTADRYAGNAADLVEFRVKPTADAIVYRITLNTVKSEDAAVVGIGIDSGPGQSTNWPASAGITTPGLDHFITAWGTGGEADGAPLPAGAVTIDSESNQMTITVPRATMDPGTATWRYVAGTGIRDGNGFKQVRTAAEPTAEEPASGSGLRGAGAVFNLAFRFDEPQTKFPMPPYDTFPGIGNWFEDKQAQALRDGSSGGFQAAVDFAKLAAGANEDIHAPGTRQSRIFGSSLDLPEGVKPSGQFPAYGGKLQPYILAVPPSYTRGKPTGLTFSLHSLGGTYTQYSVFSPNQYTQFADERGDLVVTTLGRGTNGWYMDEAEADFFEVWADVARHFTLDSERVALSGYSMGGYGTYRLGVKYPDLFGKAFTTVGPPGRGIWVPPASPPSDGEFTNSHPLLENVRWIPYLNWVEAADQLVPYVGPRAQQERFDSLGLRSQLWTFTPGEHFTLAVLDQWGAARDFLGKAEVKRDPWRVDYAFFPSDDVPRLGLVHDHAYWVSQLRARTTAGDPKTKPARGEINARSLAFGIGDPETAKVTSGSATAGPPSAATVEGTEWKAERTARRRDRLDVDLENVGSGTVDGVRAKLGSTDETCVKITSDGASTLRIEMPLEEVTALRLKRGGCDRFDDGARAARAGQVRAAQAGGDVEEVGPDEVTLRPGGATIATASGTREYLLARASSTFVAENASDADERDTAGGGGGGGGDTAGAGDSGGGDLPFTGLAVAALVMAGALMLVVGLALRRRHQRAA